MSFLPRKIWRYLANFFYLAIKSLTSMEPVGNIESPLREVFQQNTGLHTYWDHTLVGIYLCDQVVRWKTYTSKCHSILSVFYTNHHLVALIITHNHMYYCHLLDRPKHHDISGDILLLVLSVSYRCENSLQMWSCCLRSGLLEQLQ